jgi:hypothetical protein
VSALWRSLIVGTYGALIVGAFRDAKLILEGKRPYNVKRPYRVWRYSYRVDRE